jgi:hypothetical protein
MRFWYVEVDYVGLIEVKWTSASTNETSSWWIPYVYPKKWFARDKESKAHYCQLPCVRQNPECFGPEWEYPIPMIRVASSVFLVHNCKWESEQKLQMLGSSASEAKVWRQSGTCRIAEACQTHGSSNCTAAGCANRDRWTPQHLHSDKNPFWVVHDRSTGYYQD